MNRIHAIYAAIIAVLVFALAALTYQFLIAGKTTTVAGDARIAIVLEPAERGLILAEMRGFLGAIQVMTEALARADLKPAAAAARAMGMQATHDVPATLAAKLPLEFKQLGFSVHQDFDRLAVDAEAFGDGPLALQQLGQILAKCVACHGAYQLKAPAIGP
jgi:hypothetical protein